MRFIMKRKIFAGLSAFALVAGFWACGDGSVEALNDDDLTVKGILEDSDVDTTAKSGFFKPEDVETAKADCLLNEKCKAAMDKAAGDSVVPTSEAAIPAAYSSSSPANPGSSSAKGPIVNYSSASVTPVAGSSSSATSSGQTTVSSSSEEASVVGTDPDGSCSLSPTGALQKGEKATWTFTKAKWGGDMINDLDGYKAYNSSFETTDCVWTLTGSNEKSTTVKCSQASVTATYAGIGSYSASISVGGKKHDCSGKVEVVGSPVTGCTCSVDENAPNVTNGAQTVTWTISDCATEATESGFTYKWTGATGSSNTATASFSAKGDAVTPSVVVTNKENASKTVTCPTATAIDLTQPDNFSCSVSPNAINLGESFTFTVSGYSGTCWSASFSGDGASGQCGTSFNVTPSKAGVLEYEYKLANGSAGGGTCVQYVTVTDNSDSWTPKNDTLSYGGAAKTFESGYIYSIIYTDNRGQLVCSGSGAISCNGETPKPIGQSAGSYSACTTVKVFGTASCSNTW